MVEDNPVKYSSKFDSCVDCGGNTLEIPWKYPGLILVLNKERHSTTVYGFYHGASPPTDQGFIKFESQNVLLGEEEHSKLPAGYIYNFAQFMVFITFTPQLHDEVITDEGFIKFPPKIKCEENYEYFWTKMVSILTPPSALQPKIRLL